MSNQIEWGSAVPMRVFEAELRRLGGADAFQQAHNHPFLLLHGNPNDLPPVEPMKSGVTFSADGVLLALALPLTTGGILSVGRTPVNDVVLPHATVSSTHGWFRFGSEGVWSLSDNSSRNGTFIAHERIPSGDPGAPLHNGANVRFGSVSTTWLEAALFARFVAGHAS